MAINLLQHYFPQTQVNQFQDDTGDWEPDLSQISVNQFIIKCIVPNLSFKQQLRNRWFHNWLIISTLEHSRFPTSPYASKNPGTSDCRGLCYADKFELIN